MHEPPDNHTIPATALPLHLIADLDLASLPERLDDRQLATVKRIMDAPLPSLPPCDDRHLLQSLRVMLAVLPRQHSDDLAGELFVETYRRQLNEYPAPAISYMVDQATRRCRWFPTIAECIEIIGGWRRHDADTMRRDEARSLYYREHRARNPRPADVPFQPWHPTAEEIAAIRAQAASNLKAG